MTSYEDQLRFKKKVVDKAYENFSGKCALSIETLPISNPIPQNCLQD